MRPLRALVVFRVVHKKAFPQLSVIFYSIISVCVCVLFALASASGSTDCKWHPDTYCHNSRQFLQYHNLFKRIGSVPSNVYSAYSKNRLLCFWHLFKLMFKRKDKQHISVHNNVSCAPGDVVIYWQRCERIWAQQSSALFRRAKNLN